MGVLKQLVAEFAIRTEKPFVMRSQLKALAKQLPLLYVMLCTNAVALAFTHFRSAPWFLTVLVPAILVPVCMLRVVTWRRLRFDLLTDQQVTHQLRRSLILVTLLGVSFTFWSLSLLGYGDAFAQAHVAFFMSITVVGCIFCLIHLRPAALALTGIVIIPFTVRFLITGEIVLVALAINFVIVSIVMTFMMLAYYKDFRDLVHSREDQARLSEENRRAANIDILTGLANRRCFFHDLEEAIERHDRTETSFALGLIDLDGFKPVNDLHGHQAGDQVLVAISRRLEAILPPTVRIARLGGDEFGLILPCDETLADIAAIGRLVCATVAEPIGLTTDASVVTVAASIGFAVFPAMGRSQDQLIERADFALYHAKNRCRGTWVTFTEDHAVEIRNRRQLDYELQHADLDAELSLLFQPLVDVRQNCLIGYEALARWTSPTLGPIPPDVFISAAERLGLIREMTRVLFRKACAAAKEWPIPLRLSFNLSAADLAGESSHRLLSQMVRDCGLSPHRITLEITETAIMDDFERACTALQALRDLGCHIALDDFGTGYSSLSYVHRFPLDHLKIDKSFVRSLTTERTSRMIIETIVDLSENLGIACLVEGVETIEQVEILQSIGCTSMQGYFFARPMTQAAVLMSDMTMRRPNAARHIAA